MTLWIPLGLDPRLGFLLLEGKERRGTTGVVNWEVWEEVDILSAPLRYVRK